MQALKEYLESLTFPIDGQKHLAFEVVREHKAEPEDMAAYPGACVFTDGEIRYNSDDGPLNNESHDEIDEDHALFYPTDLRFNVQVHAWTNEDFHREQVLMMLEDGFSPVDWASGFMLDMPHYHGLRATYILESLTYEDSAEDNQRRYRKVQARLLVTSPQARVLTFARFRPRASVEVTE